MNSTIKWLLAVISAMMRGEEAPMPASDVDQAFAARVAAFAHVDAILYYAKQSLGLPISSDEDDRFISGIVLDNAQRDALAELLRVLPQSGIRVMPLKGSRLKSLYPTPENRYMGDIDLLYDGDDEALLRAMTSLGYTATLWKRSEVHHVFQRGDISIELHFRLLHKRSPLELPLSDLTDRLRPAPEGEGVFDLDPSDFYLHLIAHAIMHLLEGGTGIRTFLDLGLYLRAHPELKNDSRVITALSDEGLDSFVRQAEHLSAILLDGEVPSKEDELALMGLLHSGIFGTEKGVTARSLNREGKTGVSRGVRIRYFISRIFPPLSLLSSLYPSKNGKRRSPLLYPILWLRRFLDILFSGKRRKRIKKSLTATAKVSDGELAAVRFEQSYFRVSTLTDKYEVHPDEN